MLFLDINTFFAARGGGIRTYHRAKIAWFERQDAHRYLFVFPGPRRCVREQGGAVTLAEVYGPAVTKDPAAYRLILDYPRVFSLIRRARPDVIEAGDPWFTGPFCLALKKCRIYRGLLASFYHSDPVPSYLAPWAARGRARALKRLLVRMAGGAFYRMQRGYDVTLVSSRTMAESLRARGVAEVAHLPFGAPALFLDAPPARPRTSGGGEVRLLYAGRLDEEKGIALVLDLLPEILAVERVRATVIGRGARAADFSRFRHPRFAYLGFIEDPAKVRDIYDSHDILLAPGPFETFGLSVLEAMARGMAVVGPDAGGTGELLREAGSRLTFRAGDAGDFLRAVQAALDCDFAAEALRARALAVRYGTWDAAIARMVEFYAARVAKTSGCGR